jgi:hypothetical protein
MLALLHRGLEDSAAAIAAFRRAACLAPDDPLIAHGLARATWEAGLPAVNRYRRALSLAGDDASVRLGLAAALSAVDRAEEALTFLADRLRDSPRWVEGHQCFARICALNGMPGRATETLDLAQRSNIKDASLHLARIAVLVVNSPPETVLSAVEWSLAKVGSQAGLLCFQASAHSELGQTAAADATFSAIGDASDPSIWLAAVAHLLRSGRPDHAEALASDLVHTAVSVTAWAYRASAWSVLGDPRLDWLLQDGLIGVYDIADRLPELDRLADALRRMHVARGAPLDQSVRGGTQTDGPLLARVEPEIRALRRALLRSIERHIEQLPAIDPNHPTMSAPKGEGPRFAGSWSVRLTTAGHHVPHVHPMGWLSSALYVSLPGNTDQEGGALTLGAPPASLGLDIATCWRIPPKPGRLVLFPSFLWHSTTPFDEGERLTVAFDVERPLPRAAR